MTLLPHLWRLSRLRRFEAEVSFVTEPLRDPDRKQLARRLHEAVLDHFQPLVVPEELCAIS